MLFHWTSTPARSLRVLHRVCRVLTVQEHACEVNLKVCDVSVNGRLSLLLPCDELVTCSWCHPVFTQ